jgi:hypothetical protein
MVANHSGNIGKRNQAGRHGQRHLSRPQAV